MKRVRMSAWEMDGALYPVVDAARAKRGLTWRHVQEQGLRLLLAHWGDSVSGEGVAFVSPAAGGAAAGGAAAGGAAAPPVAPVAEPEPVLSEIDKDIRFFRNTIARNEAALEEAKQKCITEPTSLTWPNLVRVCPLNIARAQQELAKLEAQKAAETAGESQPVDEV